MDVHVVVVNREFQKVVDTVAPSGSSVEVPGNELDVFVEVLP